MSDLKYEQQYHKYGNVNFAATNTGRVNVNCPFMVKKIKFSIGYLISADNLVNYIVTSDIVNSDIVGVLNKFIYQAAGPVAYWHSDRPSERNVIEYTFRQPQRIMGDVNFYFNQVGAAAVINSANAIIHMEMLG